MVLSGIDKNLAEARRAYRQRDKHKGAQLVDEILQEDFNHQGSWRLLYRLYGGGRPFVEFQRWFAEEYYPDKIHLLEEASQIYVAAEDGLQPVSESAQPERKTKSARTNWIARIKELLSRKRPVYVSEAEGGTHGLSPDEEEVQSGVTDTPPRADVTRSAEPSPTLESAPHREAQSRQASPVKLQAPPVSPPDVPADDLPNVSVVVVDDIAQTRENIIRSLRFRRNFEVVGTATNGAEAIELAKKLKPDVVLMDVNMPDMDGITATENIRREVPYSQIVILTVQDDTDYIRRAMMSGARDFLTKPPMIDELVDAVQRAGEMAHKERSKAPPVFMVSQKPIHIGKGKVIVVYSPRGGTGCTMLASNLAASLHNEDSRVALVDGNLQFGDVPIFFNVVGALNILDLAPRVDELDPELIDEVMSSHPSGIHILSPPRPEGAEQVSAEQFAKLVSYIAKLYAYVIVDADHRLSDITLAAFDASDLIVLVTSQDVPSIARTQKFFGIVPLLKLDPRKILVVMNKFDPRIGIQPERVSQAFKHEIASVLPLEREVVKPSINRGTPFMLERAALSRPVSQAVLETTKKIRGQIVRLERAKMKKTT